MSTGLVPVPAGVAAGLRLRAVRFGQVVHVAWCREVVAASAFRTVEPSFEVPVAEIVAGGCASCAELALAASACADPSALHGPGPDRVTALVFAADAATFGSSLLELAPGVASGPWWQAGPAARVVALRMTPPAFDGAQVVARSFDPTRVVMLSSAPPVSVAPALGAFYAGFCTLGSPLQGVDRVAAAVDWFDDLAEYVPLEADWAADAVASACRGRTPAWARLAGLLASVDVRHGPADVPLTEAVDLFNAGLEVAVGLVASIPDDVIADVVAAVEALAGGVGASGAPVVLDAALAACA